MACVTDPTICNSPAAAYSNPDCAIYTSSGGAPLYNLPCGTPVYASSRYLIPGTAASGSPTAIGSGAQASGQPTTLDWFYQEALKVPVLGEILTLIAGWNRGVTVVQSFAQKLSDALHIPLEQANELLSVFEVGGVLLLAVWFLKRAIYAYGR